MTLALKLAHLPTDLPQVFQVRYEVFQVEQGVAPELEFDGHDERATHLLAYWNGDPVGTARLRSLTPQMAKIERVAVVRAARGLGIGKQLMHQALSHLRDRGVTIVQIHAQVPVQAFYEKLGFVCEGAPFEEAGMPHVKMTQQLS